MSNDLESAVREVLHTATDGVNGRPDVADVARRVERRRWKHRVAVAGTGLAAAAGVAFGLAVVNSRGDTDTLEPGVAPTTSAAAVPETIATVPTTMVAESCDPPTSVPFRAPHMLNGAELGPLSDAAHVAVLPMPDGVIEVWNGVRDDLPMPIPTGRLITVLGRQAPIGVISDGYSVVVDLGPSKCERWAIVAHPGVTEAQLQAVAEGLTLITSG